MFAGIDGAARISWLRKAAFSGPRILVATL
jgi:hypothetical protein